MSTVLLDPSLAAVYRSRIDNHHGIEILLDAWSAESPARRAAMSAARGDVERAGLCGGEGWRQVVRRDIAGALRTAREQQPRSPEMVLLEAEALIMAGAIVSGMERLEHLYRRGDPAGAVAFARHLHALGAHDDSVMVAQALPMHAHAALTGARAAFARDRFTEAIRFLDPFLQGMVPIHSLVTAGAVAVVAASTLARLGQPMRLGRFARSLVEAGDLPEEMMPMAARVAWTAGLAAEAWNRFADPRNPWMMTARLELASLAGNAALASQLLERVGPMGQPSVPAIRLLRGDSGKPIHDSEAAKIFGEEMVVHVWRTHPYRWQPWIDAALRTPADVSVYDLPGKVLPDETSIPHVVLDDSALIEFISPAPVPVRRTGGVGVRIEQPLCRGIGIGHDWPEEETRSLEGRVPPAPDREGAAVCVLGARESLAHLHEGVPMVVIAPPGDPFWAGPFPESAWPALRIVRADSKEGWRGAGARVAESANALLSGASA